ncbi:MAG TPA: glycine/sarcosine/betaine reductase selenoprotein B family protein [Stellaceae bacterium]|nr:glycine/sarcosine/betaine reductase selenoprotein B family protein [Stellaceae bacterium]
MYLSDMPEPWRSRLVNQPMPEFDGTPCAGGPPLEDRRISLITTAGLHLHGDRPFIPGRADWRVIPDDADLAELVTSHLATNFDRIGMMSDINTVFPIDRLRELVAAGTVGATAARHFGFMGSTPPTAYADSIKALADDMKHDGVGGVVLAGV